MLAVQIRAIDGKGILTPLDQQPCRLLRLTYPLHDRDVRVTACGRICMHRKRVNVSTVLAGQRLGIKEVVDDKKDKDKEKQG